MAIELPGIRVQGHMVLAGVLHRNSVVHKALGWVEVEDPQEPSALKHNYFVFVVFTSYILSS